MARGHPGAWAESAAISEERKELTHAQVLELQAFLSVYMPS